MIHTEEGGRPERKRERGQLKESQPHLTRFGEKMAEK